MSFDQYTVDGAATDGTAAVSWPLWGTHARVVVTDDLQLRRAHRLIVGYLREVEVACSRFRSDSEVVALTAAGGHPRVVSALLADLVRAALGAAERTNGDVDPTLGAALIGWGYDRDFADIDPAHPSVPAVFTRPARWSMIFVRDQTVTVPEGVHLDLGATAKAYAADHCAQLVAANTGCGVLVSLGGDIATAGDAPSGGWQVQVQDLPGELGTQVALPAGGALATSSTQRRRWMHAGRPVHHILDPRSGQPADPVWRTVSIAAGCCLDANTVSTACVVRGHAALGWLEQLGLPARLVDRDGGVRILGAWPEVADRAA